MRRFVDENALEGPLAYPRWLRIEQRLRAKAARLLGAAAEDVALVKNTSEGLCLIASGFDWRPGDAVVCSAGEFPTNLIPWQQLPPDFVERRMVPFDPQRPEERLIAALDGRARILAVSSVRYDSGIRLDLARLARACREHGTLLVVDAIQHLGALPLDVDRDGADFVVAGSHKWLLAPEGLALFWSRPEARARLRPVQTGWRMWPDMFDFDRADWTPPASARRFEPGTLNMAGIIGLEAAIDLLLKTDAASRGAALLAATARLIEGLSAIPGVTLHTPAAPQRRAGIVSLEVDGLDSNDLCAALAAEGIHTAVRGRLLRLSPHYYTPTAQIDQALSAIRRAVLAGTMS